MAEAVETVRAKEAPPESEGERSAVQDLMDIAALNGRERRASILEKVIGPIVDEYTEICDRQNVEGFPDDTAYWNGGFIIDEENGQAEAKVQTDPQRPAKRETKKVKSIGQRKREIAVGVQRAKDETPPAIWEDAMESIAARSAVEEAPPPQ